MQQKRLSTQTMALTLNHHTLALTTKFAVIIAVVVAFYLQDLNLVFSNAISDEATYHILAIPFLFGYLLYRKRKMVAATLRPSNQNISSAIAKNFSLIVGILLCATAILVYWFGSYTFTPIEYHTLTLPILTSGLILILFNGQTLKQLIFPIVFLIFLTPPPTEILYTVGSTLSDLSAHASNALANGFGWASAISAQYASPIITITRPDQTIMNFSIDVACSGVYSLIGFVIFATFIAYITRGKLWSKLAILATGIPLIVALNIIRITTILGLGYSYGDALALEVFHAFGATVLMFIGTLILLVTTEKFVKKPKPQKPCPTCSSKTEDELCKNCGKILKYPKIKLSKIDFAKIASIAIVTGILLSIQAPVFALTEGPPEILIQTPSGMQPNTQTLPLPQINGYNLSYIYRDSSFEELSGEDASLVYAYTSTSIPTKPTIWVALEIASTTGPLHRWETCLVNYPLSQGMQPSVTQIELTDIQIQENPPITARFFAFQYHNTNQTQAVLYWYETATFNINGTQQQKHVKMSLVTYPKSTSEVAEYETRLIPIAQTINDSWQPIKTWTAIALTISQNGLTLSALTIALLAVLLFYQLYLNQQDKKSLHILYSKLPVQTQQLVQSVQKAQEQNNPTTQGVSEQLQKQNNTPPDPAMLTEKLKELQETGLIKQTITKNNDQPTVEWRSQLIERRNILRTLRRRL